MYIEGFIPLSDYSRRMNVNGYQTIEILSCNCLNIDITKKIGVKLLVNHNETYELDNTQSTMNVEATSERIKFNAFISDQNIINKIINENIKGISFGFVSLKERNTIPNKKRRLRLRILDSICLKEISILTRKKGAYKGYITYFKQLK